METAITFVLTRYVYDSYTDMRELVRLSGLPTMYVDELRPSMPGVFITFPLNGEWRPHLDNWMHETRNAHLVLWNLERPSGSAGSVGQYGEINRELIYKRYFDEVWVSDRRLAEETALRFVPLGSDEGLGVPGKHKKFAFAHMSYVQPRREHVLKHFPPEMVGPNCWGDARHRTLMESKFALNIHQDQHPFQEPLRFALFAAYGLPILTETIYDSYPWSDEFMVFAGYDHLAHKMRELLTSDYEPYRLMGERARQRMCGEFRFKTQVEKAVVESVEKWR